MSPTVPASGHTEAGGAKYHPLEKLTERWKAFREGEQGHATRTPDARARRDEQRHDADVSVRAAGQS